MSSTELPSTSTAPSASSAAAEPSIPSPHDAPSTAKSQSQAPGTSSAPNDAPPHPTTVNAPSPPDSVVLRSPSSHTLASASPASSKPSYPPPPPEWMNGTWHVTHSTLSMWKGKANVRITYTPLPDSHPAGSTHADGRVEMPDLDDLVTYSKQGTTKVSSVHGISRCVKVPGQLDEKGWAYFWRGRGWLMIASTHWEVLGWGRDKETGRDWAVTYFGKTIFTPAGIDVYCKDAAGVSDGCLEEIKKALSPVKGLKELAGTLFEIPRE